MKYEDLKKANSEIKTTDIHGKAYSEVPQRINAFRKCFPEGFITTEIVSLADGVVTMKSQCGYYREDMLPVILGTGYAQEKENNSRINQTSFIENCVPLNTQILTRNGWKFYHQLKIGDDVLSMNIDTKKVEYCKLLKVNLYENKPLLSLKTSRFTATCTPQHKWIVKKQNGELEKKPTTEINASDKIIQNIIQDVTPSDDGRKLGWLMCDCEITNANGLPSTAYINQSKYVKEITRLFGTPTKTKSYNPNWKDNYEWIVPANEVRKILGKFGIATYKDLMNAMLDADIEDVAGCFESMCLADGSKGRFSSTYFELTEAIQVMCARLGIATTFISARMCEKSTKPIYTIGIKKTEGAYFSEIKTKAIPPQDVWCPTTENGTWFMKQDNFVTLTSNCETSSVGRCLGMAGFGIDQSVASAEEVENAIQNQTDEPKVTKSQLEVITKIYTGENLNKLLKACKVAKPEDITKKKATEIILKLKEKGKLDEKPNTDSQE